MKNLPIYHLPYQKYLKDFTHYLQYLGYAQSTVYSLPGHLQEFLYFLEQKGILKLEECTAKTQEDFMNYLHQRPHQRKGIELSKAYLNKYAQALRLFRTYLQQKGEKVKLGEIPYQKSDTNPTAILSLEEIKLLYTLCENNLLGIRDKAMLSIFYACGLRRNEGVCLDVGDVLFRRKLLYVRKGKNHRERYVPIEGKALNDLQNYLLSSRPKFPQSQGQKALFISLKGRRADGQSLNLRLQKL